MICVFFQLPVLSAPSTTFSVFNQGAASSAAAEITNEVEWLYLN